MQSLGLHLSPEQYHLQKNAAPHLKELGVLLGDALTQVREFRGTNDTRPSLAALGERITSVMEELRSVTSQDMAKMEAGVQVEERFRLLAAISRKIVGNVPHLFTLEEGTKPLRKQIVHRLRRIDIFIRERNPDQAAREPAALDAEKVRDCIEEILVVDDKLDRWMPKLMIESCNQLAKFLRRPILKTAPYVVTDHRGSMNVNRCKIVDLIETAERAIGSLGWTSHGGRSRVEPVLKKIRQLRDELKTDFYSPVNASDVRDKLLCIEADLKSLERMPSDLGPNVTFHFFSEESKYALSCLRDALKGVA